MSNTDLYVVCFQKIPEINKNPFTARVVDDLGSYMILEYEGVEIRASRGACSTTPFKLGKDTPKGKTTKHKVVTKSSGVKTKKQTKPKKQKKAETNNSKMILPPKRATK